MKYSFKRAIDITIFFFFLSLGFGAFSLPLQGQLDDHNKREPVDYADPNIGGIGHLLTSDLPQVQLPHGMAAIAPFADPAVTDIYTANRIEGFSISNSIILGGIGAPPADLSMASSETDHDWEMVTPYYASYILDDYKLRAEYTVTQHAAIYRFSSSVTEPLYLIFRAIESAQYQTVDPQTFTSVENTQGVRSYLYIKLSAPSNTPLASSDIQKKGTTLLLPNFSAARQIEVKIGMSYLSIEQARRNLEQEIPGWNFTETKNQARAIWNTALSKITVTGGTQKERAIFYSALYRSLQYMKDVTEDGRYFGPFDHQVHSSDGHDFYLEDNLWDTYRSRHPLQILLEPQRHQDMVWSYLRMYEESGWMPQFPYMNGDLLFMDGNHAAAMILDSYTKGEHGFDLKEAYTGLRKNELERTMLPYRRIPATSLDHFYDEHGYYPGLHPGEKETVAEVDPAMRRQSVSVTLDAAYDDWSLSKIAYILGNQADADFFGRRAFNYRNVFDPQTGFMDPRDAQGRFIENLNPKWSGGQAGRDYYTECNGWVFSFAVQHDVEGLIELMGGRERFVQRLDSLFSEGYDGRMKFEFLSQFPDSTAFIGQYPQGNEPSLHIPYLYDFAGAPWKTQKRVREIMAVWYQDQPLGLPGDNDNGELSSWYVFSAMGFYPVCPGVPVYEIGSPLFAETRIDVGGGKIFHILARDVSAKNKYIQAAELNGRPLDKPWINHSDLVAGGTLILKMGPLPSKSWGSAVASAPPSLSHPAM